MYIGYWGGSPKRPIGSCRWMDNVKMDLREIGWAGMD
jgi:hypothetical protein